MGEKYFGTIRSNYIPNKRGGNLMKNILGRKKTILLVVLIIAVIFVIGHMVSDHNDSDSKDIKATVSKEDTMKPISKGKEKSSTNTISESPEGNEKSALTTPSTDPATVSEQSGSTENEQNAVKRASSYLNYSAFSYSTLVDKLKSEGFTQEEADYGASHCKADWSEQAAKKAQEYLDSSSYSHQELIDKLLSEGFTQEEADYGVSAVGY